MLWFSKLVRFHRLLLLQYCFCVISGKFNNYFICLFQVYISEWMNSRSDVTGAL